MEYKSIIVKQEGHVVTITLNRPEKLNAIDTQMRRGIKKAVDSISKNESCTAVIITGSGGRAFCAGDDITYLNSIKNDREAFQFIDELQSAFNAVEALDKLVIAAVDGYCLGGGMELAMACDIRIATPTSTFGLPEVKLGILPCAGGTYRLPAIVGMGKAKELLLFGDSIDAPEALRIGLVNKIVEKKSLMKEALLMAMKAKENSHNAIRHGKRAINKNVEQLNKAERDSFMASFNHMHRKEGLGAFIKRRKPRFD